MRKEELVLTVKQIRTLCDIANSSCGDDENYEFCIAYKDDCLGESDEKLPAGYFVYDEECKDEGFLSPL